MARARSIALIWLISLSLVAVWGPAQAQEEGCSPPLPISIGQRVFTRPGVFIRNLPSISGGQVEYYNRSVTLRVVGGPVCADGYNWWQITGPDNPGWIAEGTPDFQLIFPDESFGAEERCDAPLDLGPGTQVRLQGRTRIRREAGLNGLVLTVLPGDTVLTITGSAVCANRINWWPVQIPIGNTLVDAWVAEGQAGNLFLTVEGVGGGGAAAPTCLPAYRRLGVGIRAVVTYQDFEPKNLRAQPGLNAPLVTQLLDGVAVDILDGPVCADQLNWWQVQVVGQPGVTGWMAERGGAFTGYWLIPLGLR